MPSRALTPLALAAALAAVAIAASSAGAVGTACTASSVALSSPDRATFTWTKPTTWAANGSARILARPAGSSDAFTTLATVSGFRTSGTRSTLVSIPALGAGSWSWRVELTPPSGGGAVDYCDAATPLVISRAQAPVMALAGGRLTTDGWRAPVAGQSVRVSTAPGDTVSGTAYVRFQSASGMWGTETTAPATLPSSDIVAVQAYRRSASGLTGAITTLVVRSDAAAPTAPGIVTDLVQVGATGASVEVGASTDDQSGVAHYEWSITSAAGVSSPWATVIGMRVAVSRADAGGTLRLRACDRVGHCSDFRTVSIEAAPASRAPAPGAINTDPPRITAIVPQPSAGGAARVLVTLSRPAAVSFTATSGKTTLATTTAWLGSGNTLVRIPGGVRAARGVTLTARPTSGAMSGEAATATIALPAAVRASRKSQTALTTRTRIASGGLAMLYDLDSAVREVLHPSDGAAGLTGSQGARRQEPSTSGLFGNDDEQWMIGKVKLAEIIDMSTAEMIDVIQGAIDDSPSHVIGIDEVTTSAADPAAPNVKGARAPAPDPNSAGGRFAAALVALDTPSPYGGTWASRIHVYLAPAMTSAIAAGKGPDRNLGRDGRPHFRTYRAVLGGLSRVAGVWIEMYHGLGVTMTSPFTVSEWRSAPAAVGAEFRRAGGDMSRLHMLMTGSDTYPRGGPLPAGCVTPHSCAWALAESTPAGRRILANGVGGYRLAQSARAFLAEWHARL